MVTALAVIVVIALSFQLRTKVKHKQTSCAQNMKDIVLAYNLWQSDHESKRLPWMKNAAEGGNLDFDPALRRQSWFQFSWISNELASPRALADPADKRKGLRVATSWGLDPKGGLSSTAFRNNACSYALAIDISGPPVDRPRSFETAAYPVLLVDRHVSSNGRNDRCWLASNLPALYEPFKVEWRNEVHGKAGGNLAFLSGDISYLTSPQLTNRFYSNVDYRAGGVDPRVDFYETHLLFPE